MRDRVARRLAAGMAAAAVLLAWPGPAVAAVPVVCLVAAARVDGLDPDGLKEAVDVERRKANVGLSWMEAAVIGDCPAGTEGPVLVVVVRETDRLLLERRPGVSFAVDLGTVPARERAGVAGRRIVGIVASPALVTRADVVDGSVVPRPPTAQNAEATKVPGGSSGVGGYVLLGGSGGWQVGPSRGFGGIELGAGATFLQRRLWVGVRGGYEPPLAKGWPVKVQSQAVPLLVDFRWRFPAGPVWMRTGVGVGLEWRRIAFSPHAYSTPVKQSALAMAVDVEVEVVVPMGRGFLFSVGPAFRGYPIWTDVRWQGQDTYRTPRASIGAIARIGAVFGGGAP